MAEGQFTGGRSQYVYTDDTGVSYVLTLDDTLASIVGSGLTPFDPATPGGATPPPRRFRPRGVYWQATAAGYEGRRKFLTCGTANGDLYGANLSATFEVDGIAGRTTGRRGERLTF